MKKYSASTGWHPITWIGPIFWYPLVRIFLKPGCHRLNMHGNLKPCMNSETERKICFSRSVPVKRLTGVNADHWLACKPGSESVIALGLVRQALDIGKGKFLPKSFQKFLNKATAPYSQDMVLEQSGIPLELYEKLIIQLMGARLPAGAGNRHRRLRSERLANQPGRKPTQSASRSKTRIDRFHQSSPGRTGRQTVRHSSNFLIRCKMTTSIY